MGSPIFVTGVAGFIGFHLTQRLLNLGLPVVGLDNLNDYYSPRLKKDRLAQIEKHALFEFVQADLVDQNRLEQLFRHHQFRRVIHLAAQAGVRHSLNNPHIYVKSNLEGFLNILEGCRHHGVEHLIYASSSSVYGANVQMPFSTDQATDQPVSLYGATKKANELMAHSYARIFGIASTGLRFFTVYGPWGRPDMSLYLFADAILEGRPVKLFNQGQMKRDFTYIDDVVESIVRLLDRIPENHAPASPPCRLLNVGSHSPVELRYFLSLIEDAIGKKADVELYPMQEGDVVSTFADVEPLESLTLFRPSTPLETGVKRSIAWYLDYLKQAVK